VILRCTQQHNETRAFTRRPPALLRHPHRRVGALRQAAIERGEIPKGTNPTEVIRAPLLPPPHHRRPHRPTRRRPGRPARPHRRDSRRLHHQNPETPSALPTASHRARPDRLLRSPPKASAASAAIGGFSRRTGRHQPRRRFQPGSEGRRHPRRTPAHSDRSPTSIGPGPA
jgi:hypothetical protein